MIKYKATLPLVSTKYVKITKQEWLNLPSDKRARRYYNKIEQINPNIQKLRNLLKKTTCKIY